MQAVHELEKPLCGTLKLTLNQCLEAIRKITLTVTGICNTRFRNQRSEKETLEKLVDVQYTIAEFYDENLNVGMYEYPFQIDLPEEVSHPIFLASKTFNCSLNFFLTAKITSADSQ